MYDQLFVFSVLLFTVFAVPIIAGKTKVPAIVFYILFGVILESFVFQLESIGKSFHIFSEVGKLYLMFIAGVEIDIFHFRKYASKSVLFGVLTFLLPLVLGTVIIFSVFGYSASAALLTACLFASHTLLSLAIINKFGIGNSEPVSVVVGATIISDIAVLAFLAVIVDLSREKDIQLLYWAGMFACWPLFIAAILYLVPKAARRVFRAFSEDGYAQFLFVFAAACLLSWIAHFLRLESLIGAFFCGLALCQIIPKHSILMTKINFVGNTIFIPFFFISAGMLIKPQFFATSGDALILAAALTLLAIVAKTAASYIYGRVFRYPRDAVLMAAGMTIQQAATTIVCAVVGFEAGVIDETVFNAAMLHILLTCSIGEIISVHYAERYARGLQKRTTGMAAIDSGNKTLVFVPSAATSESLLDFACLFRHYAKKYVISPLALATDRRESAAEAETILGVCMNHANELEEVYRPEMRIASNAADGILRTAVETRASMVVCPFENHSPALVDECPPRLVFTRIAGRVAETKRIIVVFMPTSEDRPDLVMLITEIRHLAQQVSAEAVFCLSENQRDKICPKIDRFMMDAVKHKTVVQSRWNSIKRDLPTLIHPRDAVLIAMGARQKLFTLPSANRYPFHLAGRFGQNSIFAAYPPLSLVDAADDVVALDENSPQGTPEHPPLEPVASADSDFRGVTAAIAERAGAGHAEIHSVLLSSLELYPVELIPGVVLVHAHTEAVGSPRVFVWRQRERCQIAPPLEIAPNALIIVLNPLHGDPQTHLKTLSRIAGIFMNPQAAGIIETCADSAELAEKLQALDAG